VVTEPAGRKPGRPKKQIVPKVKRPRGRPMQFLSEDPDRYFLAFVQAHIEIGRLSGKSDNAVAETFVGLRYGKLVTTVVEGSDGKLIPPEDNLRAFAEGRKFRVYADPNLGEIPNRGDLKYGEKWRDKNVFRPHAFDLLGKLRSVRNSHPSHPNRRWLAAMVKAWIMCLQGYEEDIDLARQLAILVSEGKYFANVMVPMMRERAAQRLEGLRRATLLPKFPEDSFRMKKLEK
jgi:hypothetical protein